MADRRPIPGKFVWFEHRSSAPKKVQGFFAEVFGWRTQGFPMGPTTYEMIYVGDTMIGGYGQPSPAGQPGRWLASVSVEDVDAAAKAASASGGKVVERPSDIPGVGRAAVIADPQGAELALLRNAAGDLPDVDAVPDGYFLWNELHTPAPPAALAFYEKVLGFTHKSIDMGPGGAYHVIARNGTDRGGVTHHMGGVPSAHWLPYVHVSDPDATVARARNGGAKIAIEPADIPGIGRFAVFQDPTGAPLAVMKPTPRAK